MKRYCIKMICNKNHEIINLKFNSLKEAGIAMLTYIDTYNKGKMARDEDFVTPVDFEVVEIEVEDQKPKNNVLEASRTNPERIPNGLYIASRVFYPFDKVQQKDIERLLSDINPRHLDALIALNELFTISDEWNEEDDFVPDYSDITQEKYFPSFKYKDDDAGFEFFDVESSSQYADSGSGICFKTAERAEQFGKQFAPLYNRIFLFDKKCFTN